MSAMANTPEPEAWTEQAGAHEALERMIQDHKLSIEDAAAFLKERQDDGAGAPVEEAEALRWLAGEYGLGFSDLTDVEVDKQLLSLFPARVLLKEELLPLRRVDGVVEVATSRLYDTEGIDTLKTLTGQKL